VQDWTVEAACALGYCGWKGGGLATVRDVEEFFAEACIEADRLLGEPGGIRHFLNWYDDTPRGEMRRQLLAEVEAELGDRADNARDAEQAADGDVQRAAVRCEAEPPASF
jgi:hypothetical protein